MSGFKDMLAGDIDNVFFNIDELADTYDIDGRKISVVQDDDRILEKTDMSLLGTALGDGLIFIKAKDMPRMPSGGTDQMMINGKPWHVRTCVHNNGVYEIRIGRTRLH